MYSLCYPHSSTSRRAKRKRNKRRNVTLCFGFYLPPPLPVSSLCLSSPAYTCAIVLRAKMVSFVCLFICSVLKSFHCFIICSCGGASFFLFLVCAYIYIYIY
ncbi:hypothetical protein, unlikely [Trypanosoma brucei brucei TREU927]|uniref:Uncharacterized protein n=1 Tax=Trypanosoma brucei brucei (strain 927/4 GUTat10.1) TaxID=185431 RepID=Q4GZ70_TRYB2|nr:hypothetical protein, unlikely [Trypanosoma brucei brucei TREU927]CAJ16123.1 hypothetical protein, unlikely [Trypanosoma brucei brucei TREU927]